MSVYPLALVVLAALIHATWNLLAKRAASAGPAFVFFSSAAASALYVPWVVWELTTGAMAWSLPIVACIVVSGALHLAYSLCLQRGYQVADLSVVYPIARGSGPLLASIGAFVLLGEPPSLAGLAGLVAIVSGILMISTDGRLSKFGEPEAVRGVRWGTATGGLIASYTVVDGYGVKLLGIHPVVLDWFGIATRLLMLLPWLVRHRREAVERMRGHWWLAIAVGALSPLSYILVLQALRLGAPLSVVAPVREMSMMVGALFGIVILGERASPWRITGCAVLMAGVVLLAGS